MKNRNDQSNIPGAHMMIRHLLDTENTGMKMLATKVKNQHPWNRHIPIELSRPGEIRILGEFELAHIGSLDALGIAASRKMKRINPKAIQRSLLYFRLLYAAVEEENSLTEFLELGYEETNKDNSIFRNVVILANVESITGHTNEREAKQLWRDLMTACGLLKLNLICHKYRIPNQSNTHLGEVAAAYHAMAV